MTVLTLTMMNDSEIASEFKATIRIRTNNSFNYLYSGE